MILEKGLHTRWKGMLAFLAFAIAGCSDGPLYATRSSHVIYDQVRDEFGHMRVFYDIHVIRKKSTPENKLDPQKIKQAREESVDYLISLWKNRNDLIMGPDLLGGGEIEFLYVGPHEYRIINLQARFDEQEAKKSLADLSKIIIRPGEFFASPEGTLCYYHCCYVPGRMIDELITANMEMLNDSLLEGLLEVQKKRKEMKGSRSTWGDLRRKLFNDVNGEANSAEKDVSLDDVLDGESIRLLVHQASGRQLTLVRARERIIVRFQLSMPDAGELEITKRAWDEWVKASLANGKSIDATNLALHNGLEMKTDSKGIVTVNVDVTARFPVRMPNGQRVNATETPEARAVRNQEEREDLATVESRGIPVNRSITFDKVLADFAKGRKK